MHGVILVDALLLFLPVTVSGYLPASFGGAARTRRPASSWVSRWRSSTASPAADASSSRATGVHTRLWINKEDLPDETVRQIAAANQRVKELEEEYLKSLDADEIAVERKHQSGLACLKVPGMLEKAAEYFRSAAELRCTSLRVWKKETRNESL